MDGVFRAVKKALKGLDGDDEEGADPSAAETFYDGLRGWNGSTSKLTDPSSDFQGDREWEALSPEERARTIRTYERMVTGLQVPLSGLLPRPEVVIAFLRKQNKERGGSGGSFGSGIGNIVGDVRIGGNVSSSATPKQWDNSAAAAYYNRRLSVNGCFSRSWLAEIRPLLPPPTTPSLGATEGLALAEHRAALLMCLECCDRLRHQYGLGPLTVLQLREPYGRGLLERYRALADLQDGQDKKNNLSQAASRSDSMGAFSERDMDTMMGGAVAYASAPASFATEGSWIHSSFLLSCCLPFTRLITHFLCLFSPSHSLCSWLDSLRERVLMWRHGVS
jgi:hypothetical protein